MPRCSQLDLRIRVLLVALTLLFFTCLAQTSGAQVAARPPTVVLVDVAPASEAQAARLEALRIHLSDVSARLIVEKSDATSTKARLRDALVRGRAHAAAAVLFVEEQGTDELRVYWVEPKQALVWMRRLALGGDGAAVASEKAAVVARGGVEELLEAGRLSSAPAVSVPADEPEVVPPPRPPPAREPAPRLGIGIGYLGTSFVKEPVWQHGVQFLLSARVSRLLYVAGRGALVPSVALKQQELAAELARYPVEVVLGYRAPRRLALRLEGGLFADYVVRSTTQVRNGQEPTPGSARWLIGASAKMGLDFRLGGPVRLAALFGLQGLFNHFNYLADESRERPVAISVRPLRPLVDVGAVADFW